MAGERPIKAKKPRPNENAKKSTTGHKPFISRPGVTNDQILNLFKTSIYATGDNIRHLDDAVRNFA
jgi:hypothetical protein